MAPRARDEAYSRAHENVRFQTIKAPWRRNADRSSSRRTPLKHTALIARTHATVQWWYSYGM
jgi:hypothetical protein